MRTPRLYFVNRFFYPDHSATSQILSDLAFHLADQGKAVSIITSRGLYDDPHADLPSYDELRGVSIHRVCRPRFGRASLRGRALDYLTMYYGFAAAAWSLVKPNDYLIVKTDPPLLSSALAPIARLKGVAMINWLQDLYPEIAVAAGMRGIGIAAPLLVAIRNMSLRNAVANVAIGDLMTKELYACGIGADRIATIPNWCDDESIKPQPISASPLRTEWGLEGKFVVGYAGNLGRVHEYETVLGAAELLRNERDFVFLFIGGGHRTNALKAEVAKRDLGGVFQFRPYQDSARLGDALSVPDVHWISLLPKMEGLIVPSKFYGIAAAGRPMIAIADGDGEVARLVQNFDCGAAVAPGNSDGLATVLSLMREDPKRRIEMGHNARAMLDRFFSKQDALGRWTKLIDSLGFMSD